MKDIYTIFILGFTAVFIIIAYGTYRCKTTDFQDPLTKSMFGPPWNLFFDGWGISHFMFYGFLAYMFPKKRTLIIIFLLGVLWEIVESIFKDHPFYLSDCKYEVTTDKGGWWYGRWQDIIMNSLGMATGVFMRRYI
jgi:hypothetical protein